jgi:hypothetical protein
MFLQSMYGGNLDNMKNVHITTSQYQQVVSQSTSGVYEANKYEIGRDCNKDGVCTSSEKLIVIVDANEL